MELWDILSFYPKWLLFAKVEIVRICGLYLLSTHRCWSGVRVAGFFIFSVEMQIRDWGTGAKPCGMIQGIFVIFLHSVNLLLVYKYI